MILNESGQFGASLYTASIPNGYVKAEFLIVDETGSFGFAFRQHRDPDAVSNEGWASDFIVIKKTPGQFGVWEWRHHVRDRFTVDLSFEETLAAKGTLTNVITGARGWNRLGVFFSGTEGGIVFNDEAITFLRLDEVDSGASYSAGAISGFYDGDSVIEQPLRNAIILCAQ